MMGAHTGDGGVKMAEMSHGVCRVKVGKERIAELTMGQGGQVTTVRVKLLTGGKEIFGLGQGW